MKKTRATIRGEPLQFVELNWCPLILWYDPDYGQEDLVARVGGRRVE